MQKENTTFHEHREEGRIVGRCRVLFVIRALAYGGAERQLIELVRAMDKERFQITLATFYNAGKLGNEARAIAGIRVVSLHKKGRWDLASFLFRFVRLVRQIRPDIVHGYMGTSNELALLARWLIGARAVWGIRGSKANPDVYHDWVRHLSQWTERKLSRFADCIIVNSRAGRDDHLREGYEGSRMKVISNGIDTARFIPDPRAGLEIRREWEVPIGTPLIGLVARVDPMKGHTVFLKAAALMASRRPEVRFACIGDGAQSYRDRLMALSEELGLRDCLAWHPARRDIEAVYNALTVVTSSSTFGEGFSNVVGEAMACGRPVAATDVGDAAMIGGGLAVIVPRGSPEKLAGAWEQLLDEPADVSLARTTMGRERISAEYGMARLAGRTEAALLEILPCQK
ncbi:MAG TPA: glycosyltransferase [Chthoniobacteraceae bacterium]|nr:glycosyltransferase [Chthoniobacteraceae bacterium]